MMTMDMMTMMDGWMHACEWGASRTSLKPMHATWYMAWVRATFAPFIISILLLCKYILF